MTTWPQLLARIDISGLRPPTRFVYEHGHLRVEWFVPDRETGVEFWQHSALCPVFDVAYDNPSTHQWLRHLLTLAASHEIDEAYKVDGRRVFDPHRVTG